MLAVDDFCDELVVDLPVRLVPLEVLVSLLDHGDEDDEDERRPRRERGHRRVDEQLHHGHRQKVEVGDATELLEQIPREEGQHVVLGRLDLVVHEHGLRLFFVFVAFLSDLRECVGRVLVVGPVRAADVDDAVRVPPGVALGRHEAGQPVLDAALVATLLAHVRRATHLLNSRGG